jgi:hypothetical protein
MRGGVIEQRRRHDDGFDAPRATGRRPRQWTAAGKTNAPRPGYSHVTLHRCGAQAPRNETALSKESRSRRLHAGIEGGVPAPGKDSPFPGKPRDPDERFDAHGVVYLTLARPADGVPSPDGHFVQITRKAMIIMLRRPTATIVLVVISISVSITGIGRPPGASRHAPRSGNPVSRSRCSKGRDLRRHGGCRSERCRCLPAACRRGGEAQRPPGCGASAPSRGRKDPPVLRENRVAGLMRDGFLIV